MGKEREEEKEEKEKEEKEEDALSEPGAGNRVRAKFSGGEELEESDDRVGPECRRIEVRTYSGILEGTPVPPSRGERSDDALPSIPISPDQSLVVGPLPAEWVGGAQPQPSKGPWTSGRAGVGRRSTKARQAATHPPTPVPDRPSRNPHPRHLPPLPGNHLAPNVGKTDVEWEMVDHLGPSVVFPAVGGEMALDRTQKS